MSEVQQLRDRVAELERVLGMTAAVPLRRLLQPPNRMWLNDLEPLCGMLLSRECVNRAAAFIVLYGARPDSQQPEDDKIIDILICRLRKVLEPYDVKVQTLWGRGYFISKEDKAKLNAVLERKRAELT